VLDHFREVVAVDFEFAAAAGCRPVPVCLVAHELRSGRKFRVFEGEFGSAPPYACRPDVLTVAYYASAEFGCYRALGWPMPERVLDLYCEFRALTNMANPIEQKLRTPAGRGLLGALTYYGLDGMGASEKKELQEALGKGTWRGCYTPEEIMDYCEHDVDALGRLLPAMLPQIDLRRALLRGRFMAAAAAVEWNGAPIDTEVLEQFLQNWEGLQDRLIAEVDKDYGVFDGRTFKSDRWAAWLAEHNIHWPCLESGRLALDDDTFRQIAKSYPIVSPIRELRHALSELRLNDLRVGPDGRNRTMLSAFASRSGRCQPSNTKYIFGPSVWLRGLIKPPPGHGVAYIDWSQQEFGIAAALSGDPMMIEAYRSGDPYLAFARQAGAVPNDATKDSHGETRELFKQCVLAVQYGMGADSLALRINQPPVVARDLLRSHHEVNRIFWRFSDAIIDCAMLRGSISTVFGWPVHTGESPNPRFLRNYVMQANGSEMLRLACCLATERGIEVCALIHDAILICAPLDRLDADIATARAAMAEASRLVLGGFELRTDCPDEYDGRGKRNQFPQIIRYPNRYMDKRGAGMWNTVTRLLASPEMWKRA
jgi:DNA polymerase-1